MDQVDFAAKLLNEGSGITFITGELSDSANNWINEVDRLLKQILGEHKRYHEFLKLKNDFHQADSIVAFETAKSNILKILSIFAHAWDFMKSVQ